MVATTVPYRRFADVTSADRKALLEYIRSTADLLCLRDWTFEVDCDPVDDEDRAVATCWPSEGRRVATIAFAKDFREKSREEQRHAVVHELLHCHHAAAADIVRLDLIKQLSQSTYDVLWFGFKRQIEYMVDALADAFAPMVPFIEWPTSGRKS